MSEDLTNRLRTSDRDVLTLILTTVQSIDKRFDRLEARIDKLEARIDKLEARIDKLEARIELRFQKIEADIAQLYAAQEEMCENLRDISRRIAELARNQTGLNDTVRKMEQKFQDIFERLHLVEVTRNQQNSTT